VACGDEEQCDDRKKRYRRRLKGGKMCETVVLAGQHIDLMVHSEYLPPGRDVHSRKEIKQALQRMLDDAAAADAAEHAGNNEGRVPIGRLRTVR
jgi:hypothetical protein